MILKNSFIQSANSLRCLMIVLICTAAPVSAALKGDTEAVVLAERIIESVGGKALWTKIKALYVIENSRSVRSEGILGEFWRDLETPRERYILSPKTGPKYEFWWDTQAVQQTIDGVPNTKLAPGLREEVIDYWKGEIYVMYHRLAMEDPNLWLEKLEGNSFSAFDTSKGRTLLGTFLVNGEGHLYRWRHADSTEYIYGPLKDFGDIKFPQWGTQVDGSWSFSYVEIKWFTDASELSYKPLQQSE
jgi:hypothetical protein